VKFNERSLQRISFTLFRYTDTNLPGSVTFGTSDRFCNLIQFLFVQHNASYLP
jgi:hypothetical protein